MGIEIRLIKTFFQYRAPTNKRLTKVLFMIPVRLVSYWETDYGLFC